MTDETLPAHMGLLIVRMEPMPQDEEEFNDWYDSEHVPQRLALTGLFLNARRFVCIGGWPKYAAVYDLRSPDVIRAPEYLATSYAHFTPWTKRMLARVSPGWSRLDLEQIYPGATIGRLDWQGLALYEFGVHAPEQLLAAVARISEIGLPIGVRAFQGVSSGRPTSLLMVESPTTACLPPWRGLELRAILGDLATELVSAQEYVKYWRMDALAALARQERESISTA